MRTYCLTRRRIDGIFEKSQDTQAQAQGEEGQKVPAQAQGQEALLDGGKEYPVSKRLWFLPVVVVVLAFMAFTASVGAQVAQPTSLRIDEITAYQNVREDGDQLYLVVYYIAQNTTYGADQLYIFRLLDAGGAEISRTTCYPYNDNGFGLGVVAFYVDADDAPTWGSNVRVRISGNPLADWDGATPSTQSSLITWNTGTTQEMNTQVSVKIMQLATRLELTWGVAMTETTQGVTVLSSTGAAYFLRVVPYLSEVAPYVLGQYTFLPDYPEQKPELGQPYGTDFADQMEQSILGTIFDLTGPARSLGMSRGALTAALYYIFVTIFFILLIHKLGLRKGMMLLLWPFVIAGAFIGVPLIVTIVGAFLCLGATVWVIYKGSTA